MIDPKNNDENNKVTIAGTDFFTDTESFLNELTDSELVQVRGGADADGKKEDEVGTAWSSISLFFCH